MSESRERSEHELIAQLRAGLDEIDPVPEDVSTFAKAALGWRQIDAELASLTFDSDVETPAAVRSTTTTRMLTFEAGEWSVDIEYDPATRQLLGQVTPETRVTVAIHHDEETSQATSDDRGRFEFEGIGVGPMSLGLHDSDGEVLAKTEWTVL